MARGPFGLGCFTFQECAASLRCRGPWVLGRLSPLVDRAGQCLFGSEGCGISNMRSPNRARLVFTLRTCTGEVAEDAAAFRLRSLAGIRGASSYALPAEAWKRKGRGLKRAVPLGHSDQDAHSARGCRALAVNMTYEQHATYDGCSSRHAKDPSTATTKQAPSQQGDAAWIRYDSFGERPGSRIAFHQASTRLSVLHAAGLQLPALRAAFWFSFVGLPVQLDATLREAHPPHVVALMGAIRCSDGGIWWQHPH